MKRRHYVWHGMHQGLLGFTEGKQISWNFKKTIFAPKTKIVAPTTDRWHALACCMVKRFVSSIHGGVVLGTFANVCMRDRASLNVLLLLYCTQHNYLCVLLHDTYFTAHASANVLPAIILINKNIGPQRQLLARGRTTRIVLRNSELNFSVLLLFSTLMLSEVFWSL